MNRPGKILLILVLTCSIIVLAQCSPAPVPSPAAPEAKPAEVQPTAVEAQPTLPPASAEAPQPTQPSADAAPALDGKSLAEARCADCHTFSKVTKQQLSLEGWTKVVNRMVDKGATLNEAEKAAVIQYLAETYK